MPGATLSTIANVLKTQWEPKIQDNFQENAGLWTEALKRKKKWQGGDIEVLVRTGKNTSVGWRSDGDTLPAAGNQSWQRQRIDPKLLYGRLRVSGPSLIMSSGGPLRVFVEGLKSEAEFQVNHLKKRACIQIWGGQEGYLAQIGSANDGADTLTLDGTGTAGVTSLNGNRGSDYIGQFAGEILIDVVDSDGSTIHVAGAPVSAINHATGVITLGGSPNLSAVADGDFVAMASGKTTSDTWVANALEGLQNHILATGSIHGLSRVTYPQLKSVVLTSSALRPISDSIFEDLLNSVKKQSGVNCSMVKGYRFITSQKIVSEWALGQVAARRYDSTKIDAGYSSDLTYRNVPVVADLDAPFEQVFLLNLDDLQLNESFPLGFADKQFSGTNLLQVADVDAYEERLRWMGELWVKNLHAQGRAFDISETPVKFT